jgi:hypothetical protein
MLWYGSDEEELSRCTKEKAANHGMVADNDDLRTDLIIFPPRKKFPFKRREYS